MKKIRIIADTGIQNDEGTVKTRGFISDFAGGLKSATLELDSKVLSEELKDVYKMMVDALSDLQDINPAIELKDVQFTLGFDTTGQVSLFSTIGGANTTKTGITFNIAFRK